MAAILAWIVSGIIIGLAIISDYKKAELLKNGTRIIGKVTATKRVTSVELTPAMLSKIVDELKEVLEQQPATQDK